MKLEKLALIAEIIGGAAIVLSLIFVGFQIRASNRVAQAAMYQENLVAEIGIAELLGSDPELARLHDAAWNGLPEACSSENRVQAGYLLLATIRLWEGYYLQYLSGTLSEAAWSAREPAIRRTLRNLPDTYLQSDAFAGPFRDYVTSIAAENSIPAGGSVSQADLSRYVGTYTFDSAGGARTLTIQLACGQLSATLDLWLATDSLLCFDHSPKRYSQLLAYRAAASASRMFKGALHALQHCHAPTEQKGWR